MAGDAQRAAGPGTGDNPWTMQPSGKPTEFALDLAGDLHKWRAFVAIGELGSLTRAAVYLDSNQSLLSRQLNALERECGARLFNRTGRGVELSEVGERLFPRVKALLASAQQLETEIRSEVHEPIGQVKLGTLPSLGSFVVGPLFGETRARHPGVSLKILEGSSGQVDEWLNDGRIDIAILYRYGQALPEHEQLLVTLDSFLIGPKGDRLTAAPEVPFDALQGLPYILPSAPNGVRTTLDQLARQRRITIAPVIEADSLPLQRMLVAEERLYTVLPIHCVWQEIRAGTVQASRIVDPPLRRYVSMAFARTKGPSRAVTTIAATLTRLVEAMGAKGLWGASAPAAPQPGSADTAPLSSSPGD